MTATELLTELDARGVRLTAHGDRLVYDAPAGMMTPDLRHRLTACKPDLLAILTGKAAPEAPAQLETHADREIERFARVAVPRPDGRGWYDPGSLRDTAGMAYLAYTLASDPAASGG